MPPFFCTACGVSTPTRDHDCNPEPDPSIDTNTNLLAYHATLVHVGIDPLQRPAAAVAELHRAFPTVTFTWCKVVVDELNVRRLHRYMLDTGKGRVTTAAHFQIPHDCYAVLAAALRLDIDLGRLAC